MRALASYDYATVRIVPRVEREEFVNAGVILYCATRDFLGCRLGMDAERVKTLWTAADVELIARHVAAIEKVCSGAEDGGRIAKLSRRERFHWLVAPRSTMIQVSPVHSGMCESPERALDELFRRLVVSGGGDCEARG
jgi:hypothetical protein